MTSHATHHGGYGRFGAVLAIDFVVMYLVMFAMIATFRDFYLNLNTLYMTLMMVAPMAIVMVASMKAMYPSRALNQAIVGLSLLVFAGSWFAIRDQAAIGDKAFIRSMIPHHSGAVLMCREAPLADQELASLCQRIIRSQQEEIDQMRTILARL